MKQFCHFVYLVIILIDLGFWNIVLGQRPLNQTLIPLTADREDYKEIRKPDGTITNSVSKGKFYRDNFGRTRTEIEGMIIISDPTTKVSYFIHPEIKIAERLSMLQAIHITPQNNDRLNTISKAVRRSLGKKVVEGITCTGEEIVSRIPAYSRIGNNRQIETKTQRWFSEKLLFPVLTISENTLSGKFAQAYKNIKLGLTLAPPLFQVPNDFKIVERRRNSSPQ